MTNSVKPATSTNQKNPNECRSKPSINAIKQNPNNNTVNRSNRPGGASSLDGENQRQAINTASAPNTTTASVTPSRRINPKSIVIVSLE